MSQNYLVAYGILPFDEAHKLNEVVGRRMGRGGNVGSSSSSSSLSKPRSSNLSSKPKTPVFYDGTSNVDTGFKTNNQVEGLNGSMTFDN